MSGDIAAFKAANPGAELTDFVRWHSRSDWLVPEGASEAEGRLSARMVEEGNMWQTLWNSTPPQPAGEQPPLFDEQHVGDGVVECLRGLAPSEVLETAFLSALGAAHHTAASVATLWHVPLFPGETDEPFMSVVLYNSISVLGARGGIVANMQRTAHVTGRPLEQRPSAAKRKRAQVARAEHRQHGATEKRLCTITPELAALTAMSTVGAHWVRLFVRGQMSQHIPLPMLDIDTGEECSAVVPILYYDAAAYPESGNKANFGRMAGKVVYKLPDNAQASQPVPDMVDEMCTRCIKGGTRACAGCLGCAAKADQARGFD